MSMIPRAHKETAPHSVGIFIVTCSTSRYNQVKAGQKPDDPSGDLIAQLATEAGHIIEGRDLISDSEVAIRKAARNALASKKVDTLIITGGTGISPRDVTVETIAPMMEKDIPGFGELFRKLSYDSIGAAAMMSRAFAGIVKGKAVFCLPGSPDAVRTAVEKLILPELGHLKILARQH